MHTVFIGIYVHFMYCICAYVAMYAVCVGTMYTYIHYQWCYCIIVYVVLYINVMNMCVYYCVCMYVYSLGVVQVCTVKSKTHVAGMITMFALLFRYRI